MHSAMENALYAYMDKAWRCEFGAQETDRNLLQEEYLSLKARVEEVENIMKETLEFVDKL